MKKHKVTSQIKKQDKTSEKQLNEVEIGNFPEKKKFRIMIVKMTGDMQEPSKYIIKRKKIEIENKMPIVLSLM